MCMSNSMDIRPCLVDFWVNQESCCIGGSRSVSSYYCSSMDIETDEIASGHESEVSTKWIHPYSIWEFGIADGDVTAYALGEFATGEEAEDGCCVDEDVFALCLERGEFGNAWWIGEVSLWYVLEKLGNFDNLPPMTMPLSQLWLIACKGVKPSAPWTCSMTESSFVLVLISLPAGWSAENAEGAIEKGDFCAIRKLLE